MPTARNPMERYGRLNLTRADVRAAACMSIDLRTETGARGVRDETRLHPVGVFSLSVFEPINGEPPVGEVRCMVGGREVAIVGALTGRPGVVEVTPDHLVAATRDPAYRSQIGRWIGLLAS